MGIVVNLIPLDQGADEIGLGTGLAWLVDGPRKINARLSPQILDDESVLNRTHIDRFKVGKVAVLEGECHLLLGQHDDLRNGNRAVGNRDSDGLHDLVNTRLLNNALKRSLNGTNEIAYFFRDLLLNGRLT